MTTMQTTQTTPNLQTIQSQAINKINDVKRGRGRPKKDSSIPSSNFNTAPYSTPMGIQEAPKTSYKITLRAIFQFSGETLAATTSYEKMKLENDEIETLATQGDECLMEFFPAINNRYGKLVAFIISLLGVFGKRWFSYSKWIEIKNKETKTEKQNENVTKINPHVTIHDTI